MHINLISDTITRPSREMREYMMNAEVGDDVFGEDPTINKLQSKMADMFGKEAAIFCPSGTMTNQIAIKLHTQGLDEMICEESSHVFQYETGGYAYNSRIGVNLIRGEFGKLTADQVDAAVKPVHDWLPISRLLVLENSTNKGGGNYYTLDEIAEIKKVADKHGLKMHLDGARLFNVLIETGESCMEVGKYFDTISICLSKGLGAPVGSVLIGTEEKIRQARRYRKVMGGGMRQAGIIAAACIYALDNNIERLKEDNNRARQLGAILEKQDYVEMVYPVKTNIVIFKLRNQTANTFIDKLKSVGINAAPFGPKEVRFVTHLHFGVKELQETESLLGQLD